MTGSRFFLAACFVLTVAAEAQGQAPHPGRRSSRSGFFLGAYALVTAGTSVDGNDVEGRLSTGAGQGIGVRMGYRFSPRIAGFVQGDASRQASAADYIESSVGLTHLEIGVRATFPTANRRVTPYATAVAGTRALSAARGHFDGEEFSLRMTGTELGLGGGLLYRLGPTLSIDGGLVASRGKFNRATYRGDLNESIPLRVNGSTTVRLTLGVQWTPR